MRSLFFLATLLFVLPFPICIKGLVKPEIRPFHFVGELKLGKRTAVACSVIDGDPPFVFTWLKDGLVLKNNQEFSIANVDDYLSTLTIFKPGPDSNGNYTCRVSNTAGKDEKHDILLIKGKVSLKNVLLNSLFDVCKIL
ncbi:Down syndrome cell adhesion molecule-like protein Dscam2 isoform X2 [Stegodyphus dumicola]|nr:Down syndrome cell adhesion molecule-like protein Dscam2 isoform X2 [Stegodyphus dumicola]